jgi:hypothetical protein
MKKSNLEMSALLVVWPIVFVGIPLFFLYFTKVINDFGWYLIYFVGIVPIIFLFSFIYFWLFFKNKKYNYYKRFMIAFIILFLIEYSLLAVNIYKGLINAFGHINLL